MRAKVLCAWCEKEGLPSFLRWTDTRGGEPSHGICEYHYSECLRQWEDTMGGNGNGNGHSELWEHRDAQERKLRALAARMVATEQTLLAQIEALENHVKQLENEMWGAKQVEAENVAYEYTLADAAA